MLKMAQDMEDCNRRPAWITRIFRCLVSWRVLRKRPVSKVKASILHEVRMLRPVSLVALNIVLGGCLAGNLAEKTMHTYQYAFAPPAFDKFCREEKALCSTVGKKRSITLTQELRSELARINKEVNQRIHQVNDRRTATGDDDWRLPSKAGDCEDIAILKKSELMKRGWPASVLLLTVVRPMFGDEGHVLLTVRTSDGDLILDNQTSTVRPWSRTPYRYFARQSQDAQGEWVRVGTAR